MCLHRFQNAPVLGDGQILIFQPSSSKKEGGEGGECDDLKDISVQV
jgi:hypothetical protein